MHSVAKMDGYRLAEPSRTARPEPDAQFFLVTSLCVKGEPGGTDPEPGRDHRGGQFHLHRVGDGDGLRMPVGVWRDRVGAAEQSPRRGRRARRGWSRRARRAWKRWPCSSSRAVGIRPASGMARHPARSDPRPAAPPPPRSPQRRLPGRAAEASRCPPSRPDEDTVMPACTRSPRIWETKVRGMSISAEISRSLTQPPAVVGAGQADGCGRCVAAPLGQRDVHAPSVAGPLTWSSLLCNATFSSLLNI